MYSIPVFCDAHGGKGMLHGVVHLEDSRIRLQYQTGDAVLERLRSGNEELIAPFDALAEVHYHAGFLWMSPKVELEFSDFKLASSVPAGYSGKLELKVPRDSRAVARKFVEELARELALRRQLRLERDIQRMSNADLRAQLGAALDSATENAESSARPAPSANTAVDARSLRE